MDFNLLISVIINGIFIGLCASAPTGPVGVLCIQRTLRKGFRYGLVTGCGAALSDLLYALLTATGIDFLRSLIEEEVTRTLFQVAGSVMLFGFGLYMFLSKPKLRRATPLNHEKGTLWRNFITSFFVTLSNPLIIFFFAALFASCTFVLPDGHWLEQTVGFVAIVAGAMLWWFGLAYSINKVRQRFSPKYIRWINLTIGGAIIIVSIVAIVLTILGQPMLFH